jgi:predicted metal-dependent phosphoesterase TrpH
MKKIDLHMHTTVSDGTDRPEEILEKAREAGLYVFSVSDHDAIKCSTIIPGLLKNGDPEFITGVEFSCKDEEGKYHILGYGYDPEGESIRRVVEQGHAFRMDTVRRRLAFLSDAFGFTFPKEETDALLSLDNPGKPHIGNLMVKYGYAKTKEEAILEYINKMPRKEAYVDPKDAIEGILGAGGIPVLAHPFFGSGSQTIPFTDIRDRVGRLKSYGLSGIEGFYSGFDGDMIRYALEVAEEMDLYVTAGSDYHGGNKTVKLGDTGLERILSEMPGDPSLEKVPGLLRFLQDVKKSKGVKW